MVRFPPKIARYVLPLPPPLRIYNISMQWSAGTACVSGSACRPFEAAHHILSTANRQRSSVLLSGKKKTHKYKQMCRIVAGPGWVAKICYVCFSGRPYGGERNT